MSNVQEKYFKLYLSDKYKMDDLSPLKSDIILTLKYALLYYLYYSVILIVIPSFAAQVLLIIISTLAILAGSGLFCKYKKFWIREFNITRDICYVNEKITNKDLFSEYLRGAFRKPIEEEYFFIEALNRMSSEFIKENYKDIILKSIKLNVEIKTIKVFDNYNLLDNQELYNKIHTILINHIHKWIKPDINSMSYYLDERSQNNLKNIFSNLKLYEFEKKYIMPLMVDFLDLDDAPYNSQIIDFLKRNNANKKYFDTLKAKNAEIDQTLDYAETTNAALSLKSESMHLDSDILRQVNLSKNLVF